METDKNWGIGKTGKRDLENAVEKIGEQRCGERGSAGEDESIKFAIFNGTHYEIQS
jgi:hypothetical protein